MACTIMVSSLHNKYQGHWFIGSGEGFLRVSTTYEHGNFADHLNKLLIPYIIQAYMFRFLVKLTTWSTENEKKNEFTKSLDLHLLL